MYGEGRRNLFSRAWRMRAAAAGVATFFSVFAAKAQSTPGTEANAPAGSAVSFTAAAGIPLATSIAKIGPGSTLIVPAGVWMVASAITPPPDVTISCQAGAVIEPSVNQITMLTPAHPMTIDGCTFDGQFSHGRIGVAAIRATGPGVKFLKISNSSFQNMDGNCITILNTTGTFISSYNRFQNIGNGKFDDPGHTGVGLDEVGNTGPGLYISDHDYFYNFTSSNAAHFIQNDISAQSVFQISSPTCIRQVRACLEANTQGALSVQITNPVITDFSNNKGLHYEAGISWAMIGSVGPSVDGTITLQGGTISVPLNAPPGHGYAFEVFSHHAHVDHTVFSGPWGAIAADGAITVTGAEFDGTVYGVGMNSTFPNTDWIISDNIFRENCTKAIYSVYPEQVRITGNTIYRVAKCPADAGATYYAVDAGSSTVGGTMISGNQIYFNSDTAAPGFQAIAFDHVDRIANDFAMFSDNQISNLGRTAFGSAFIFPGGTGSAVIRNTIMTNLTGSILSLNRQSTLRSTGNIDTMNTISGVSNGAFLIDGKRIPFSQEMIACNSYTLGMTANFLDSTTTEWGGAIRGGGSNPVTGVCNGSDWTVRDK